MSTAIIAAQIVKNSDASIGVFGLRVTRQMDMRVCPRLTCYSQK